MSKDESMKTRPYQLGGPCIQRGYPPRSPMLQRFPTYVGHRSLLPGGNYCPKCGTGRSTRKKLSLNPESIAEYLHPISRCGSKRPRQKLVMRDSRVGLTARSEQDFLAWSAAHEGEALMQVLLFTARPTAVD